VSGFARQVYLKTSERRDEPGNYCVYVNLILKWAQQLVVEQIIPCKHFL
jgi:hypothetical protein